jgi:hypothetical protein
VSSRRRTVTVSFAAAALEMREEAAGATVWPYAEIRRVDGPRGVLRLACLSAAPLARLEIRDGRVADDLVARCPRLDEDAPSRHSVGAIVGWSLAATVSIVMVILFGVPLAADRLAPLVPPSLERRLGDVA